MKIEEVEAVETGIPAMSQRKGFVTEIVDTMN
jgi:hypothetical protein